MREHHGWWGPRVRLATEQEAAEQIGLDLATFRSWVECGRLPKPLPDCGKYDLNAIDYYAWRGGPRLVGMPGSPEFMASYHAAYRNRREPDAANPTNQVVSCKPGAISRIRHQLLADNLQTTGQQPPPKNEIAAEPLPARRACSHAAGSSL
jgi:hypothetical protein